MRFLFKKLNFCLLKKLFSPLCERVSCSYDATCKLLRNRHRFKKIQFTLERKKNLSSLVYVLKKFEKLPIGNFMSYRQQSNPTEKRAS